MKRPTNAINSFVRPVRDHVGGGALKEKDKTGMWSR